jgi:hypothetical protein
MGVKGRIFFSPRRRGDAEREVCVRRERKLARNGKE